MGFPWLNPHKTEPRDGEEIEFLFEFPTSGEKAFKGVWYNGGVWSIRQIPGRRLKHKLVSRDGWNSRYMRGWRRLTNV